MRCNTIYIKNKDNPYCICSVTRLSHFEELRIISSDDIRAVKLFHRKSRSVIFCNQYAENNKYQGNISIFVIIVY